MAFTDIFIKRPTLAAVISLLILLIGVSAFYNLQIRQYPKMESATITIDTSLPGATQEMMQGFVTQPIAQAIATASGIEYLSSTSRQGSSHISAKLVLNADADRSMTEILAKVQTVKYKLPEGVTDPVINKITDGASAIQYVAFTSDVQSPSEIADFATRVAQPLVTAVPGVASADIAGGAPLAMRIWVDPVKLAGRNLSPSDIATALQQNNVQAAPGQLKGGGTAVSITADTDLTSVDAFRNMIIRESGNDIVRLKDVATVDIGGQNTNSVALSSGKRSVFMTISPTPDGNPLEIVASVKALIEDIQHVAPPGLVITNQFDVAHFVDASIEEVQHTLIEAIAIVIVVIFLFLGTFRAVIIPVVTIPLSLLGTAALMVMFGFSLNLLTLLAMVLAIGLVVDDAIVVVENIHRHIEEGHSPFQAALIGTREIIGPVIAMTITLAAVYAPIGMMGGLTGALFKEFAFTLAASVVVSGVIALTLSPMMSSQLLDSKLTESKMAQRVEHTMESLTNGYTRLLECTLANRPAVLLVGVAILATIVVFFMSAKRELAPQEDMGYVFVQTKAPQHVSVDYTEKYSAQVDAQFAELPEFNGSFFAIGLETENVGFGGVIMDEWSERSRTADDIQGELMGRTAGITGVYSSVFQDSPLPASTGGLPFQMVLRSPDDFNSLFQTLQDLKGAAWGSGLFAFVDSDLAFDSPQAHITVDKDKAGQLGVSMTEIANALAILVGENYVNRFNWFDRSYDVIVQANQQDRLTAEDLGEIYVRANTGRLIALSTFIDVDMRSQANQLPQFNQMNSATVSGVLLPSVTMGQAVDFMRQQPLPDNVTIDWLSNSRQFVQEGNRLTVSFIFALIVIFLVLAAQFNSFRDPLVILITVPLAICGALAPLYLGFTTLNIYTQIGLVTLIGLISKHGILMVSFANDMQQHDGVGKHEAIRHSAAVRMRPVLMTTAAMVAGLIPLLFAAGAGASSRFALGIVVVMGMLVGTFFTLFVLPTLYVLIAGDHRVKQQDDAPAAPKELAHD